MLWVCLGLIVWVLCLATDGLQDYACSPFFIGILMLFEKADEGRVQEFIAELRRMNLTVEGMVEDYDRLIALYDISFFFRIYLHSCARSLHDRTAKQSTLSAGRYIQFFETELTTMPRMAYLFQSAYGSRFVRSVYQGTYLMFIERQKQATNFLKKCVKEHDNFAYFRKTVATIEEYRLIEEPKVLNPRIKGKPHNRPLEEIKELGQMPNIHQNSVKQGLQVQSRLDGLREGGMNGLSGSLVGEVDEEDDFVL